MPTITVRDLEIQKRESDLVAATFGRSFFVLDDFAPLRQIQPQVFNDEATLFAVGRPARAFRRAGYYRAQGDNMASPNPPAGALLTYYLRDDLAGAGSGARRSQDGPPHRRFHREDGAPDRCRRISGTASHAVGFAGACAARRRPRGRGAFGGGAGRAAGSRRSAQ